jgi:uncharacterized protein with NRDE domain
MCLLVLAWRAHPRYPLIVAANRDEYHERPSAPLARWDGPAGIVGGRDLRAGGTWLAVDAKRRLGVVTNFRDLQRPKPGAPSRGDLIPGYLRQAGSPQDFLSTLESGAATYAGFNLLLADHETLWYASNRNEPFARALAPGIHGLSNQLLDTPWPKLVRVKRNFKAWLDSSAMPSAATLFDILGDRRPAGDDEELPQTGLSPEWEQIVSAPFVLHPTYGTRCSTVLLLESSGAMFLAERRFDADGAMGGETEFNLPAAQSL